VTEQSKRSELYWSIVDLTCHISTYSLLVLHYIFIVNIACNIGVYSYFVAKSKFSYLAIIRTTSNIISCIINTDLVDCCCMLEVDR